MTQHIRNRPTLRRHDERNLPPRYSQQTYGAMLRDCALRDLATQILKSLMPSLSALFGSDKQTTACR